MPPYIGNKTNFIAVIYLNGFWLNIIDFRGDVDHLLQRLKFSVLVCEYSTLLIYFSDCIYFDMIVCSTIELIDSLFLILQYIKHIF